MLWECKPKECCKNACSESDYQHCHYYLYCGSGVVVATTTQNYSAKSKLRLCSCANHKYLMQYEQDTLLMLNHFI